MKKVKIIGTIGIFLLSFISHFMYDWFPNKIFYVFFPINESIWEHMKLLFSPVMIFAIWEYFYYKKKNIKINNFILSYGIAITIGIICYLIIYMPLFIMIGHKAILAIILLIIIYGLMMVITYYLQNYKEIKYGKIIGTLLIIILLGVFYYFSYYPKDNILFFDNGSR